MNRSIAAQHSAYLPSISNESEQGTIVCCICQAAYTPSRSHTYLLQGPPLVLESALMSMCHFCFRCRRPSCPACWDEVHGVCGQCAVETGLPFRLEPAPLDGAQFTPAQPPAVPAQNIQPSLVNVQAGRFQRSSSPIDMDSVPTRPDFTGTRSTVRTQRSRPLDIDEIEMRSEQKRSPARSDVAEAKTRPDRSDIATERTRPDRSDVAAERTRPDRPRRGRGRVRRSRLLVVALVVLVILIVLLLVVALLVADGNTFLRSLLHVDIRTEIARFWHMLQHLF